MGYNPFNDPNYSGLFKIYKTAEVPAFVKEASIIEEQNIPELPHDVFGDPGKRLYPLNNRSNTWLSREYFRTDRSGYAHKEAELIDNRISKAAAFWGLDAPAKRISEDPYQGMAYHIDIKDSAEKTVFGLDMKCQNHWKEAAEALFTSKEKWSFDMRRTMAQGLLNAPEALQVKLDDAHSEYIHKAACQGTCVAQNAINSLYKRAAQIKTSNPEGYNSLMMAAGAFNETEGGFLPVTELRKVAEAIDIVDRGYGFNKLYGKGFFDTPEEELFPITEKIITKIAAEALPLTNGSVLSQSEIVDNKAKVDEFFQKYAGEIPYKDNDEMFDIIRSLPRSDAGAFESFMGVE